MGTSPVPPPSWVEQDPLEMLYLVRECIEVVCAECRKKGVDLTRVKGQPACTVCRVWRVWWWAWWSTVEGVVGECGGHYYRWREDALMLEGVVCVNYCSP